MINSAHGKKFFLVPLVNKQEEEEEDREEEKEVIFLVCAWYPHEHL